MNDVLTHSARLLRSLALTSTMLLPACSSSDPAPTAPTPTPTSTENQPGPVASASTPESAPDASTSDAEPPPEKDGGKVSGPLPPPELPVGFA